LLVTLRNALAYVVKGGKAMPKYTTEIAKLCNVTVRTVQYYDTRGILIPTEISDGGRRLYSEDDLNKMKIICFLRELGISIDSISKLFKEDNSENVISILIKQQEEFLKQEIKDCKDKMNKLETLKQELKLIDNFSFETIGGIAYSMENKAKLNKVRLVMLTTGVIMNVLQWTSFLLWMFQGWWWLLIAYVVIAIPYSILILNYYYSNIEYICPNCNSIFQPTKKEVFFARHTTNTRKLTCTSCGHHGFCVETYKVK